MEDASGLAAATGFVLGRLSHHMRDVQILEQGTDTVLSHTISDTKHWSLVVCLLSLRLSYDDVDKT